MSNITYTKKQYTIEQAEKENLILDERLGTKPIAFGFVNDDWEELKSIIKSGDKLYKFRSPDKSWTHLVGREGFQLERDDNVIKSIITKMN